MLNFKLRSFVNRIWSNKFKIIFCVLFFWYCVFYLSLRVEVYNLCENSPETIVDGGCREVHITRRILIEKKHYEKVLDVFRYRIPFGYLNEGLGDFFVRRQSIQELEIPISLNGESFSSRVTISGKSSKEGMERIISSRRASDRYVLVDSNESLHIYEQIKPKVLFNYVIPSPTNSQLVVYRCERACTATTIFGVYSLRYSFPAKWLHESIQINKHMVDLAEHFIQ